MGLTMTLMRAQGATTMTVASEMTTMLAAVERETSMGEVGEPVLLKAGRRGARHTTAIARRSGG